MSQTAVALARCIHCLSETDSPELDHVFPKSWYPDTTPKTVQRWTAPSCPKCNRAFGQLEHDLFLRMIFCVDSKSDAAAGLAAKALRTMGLDAEGLSDEEKRRREATLKKIRSELVRTEELEDKPGKIPGLGPPEGVESPRSILIPYAGLSLMAEKIVRGCEYRINNRFVEPPYTVCTFIANAEVVFPEAMVTGVKSIDFGPGCQIKRIFAAETPKVVRYWITIWGALRFSVLIDLHEELEKAKHLYKRPEGIEPPDKPTMRIRPYLREYKD